MNPPAAILHVAYPNLNFNPTNQLKKDKGKIKMYNLSKADAFRNSGSDPAYVLEIIPVAGGLAAVSSDQKLTLFNPSSLSRGPLKTIRTAHGNITCARAFDASNSIVCTAGENGTVSLWDLRLDDSKAQIAAPTGLWTSLAKEAQNK